MMFDYIENIATGKTSKISEQNKLVESILNSSPPASDLDEFFPYDLKGDFPEFFARKAERELGETPENRKKAIEELKELIKNNQKNFKTDEFFLVMFLRVKKFEAPRAFCLMQNFYEFKEKIYDTCPVDVNILRQELQKRVYTILPYRDNLGRGMYIVRMRFYNPDIGNMDEKFALNAVAILALLDDVINQVSGFVVILDFADTSLRWLAHARIRNLKYLLFLYFSALPIRFQGFHFVNVNPLFKPLCHVLQALSTRKIKNRFFFHTRNMASLHKHIPPALLPPEYGGTLQEEQIILDAEEILRNRAIS